MSCWWRIHRDVPYLKRWIKMLPFDEEVKAYIWHYAVDAAKRCVWMRVMYYIFNFLIILLPAISIILTECFGEQCSCDTYVVWYHNVKFWRLIFNSAITISGGALSLLRCHEVWTRNRIYLEQIIETVMKYSKGKESIDPKNQSALIEALSQINSTHQKKWEAERNNINQSNGTPNS